ncbi:DNA primase [Halanaerobium sp. MA284_MarDTE_T2]|nr:DNA primase [Halanaerobium sp. MA284_MarDTE_T2]RCW82551.1 DNA primase [Halanaerobium sp. DL-01]
MARYSDNFIEELKFSVDIIDVVSDYLELKRAGNRFKGLCPFHNEKTPSFFVNPDNNFYHCFGCGAGGDVINFVMEIENITFTEAVKVLAEKAGIKLPNLTDREKKLYQEREQLFEINKTAARFYNYLLLETELGADSLKYLKDRGFTEDDIEYFQLGYAPDEWKAVLSFLSKREYSLDMIHKAGLISKGKNNSFYDRFRNRIIFPIFNIRGEVIAFGGRVLPDSEQGAKYLNSPETAIFSKKKNLYGLNRAKKYIRQEQRCIIMEGYTDVIQAHKKGIKNAVASLGTAFTDEQAKLIKRYADQALIAYDSDTAGNKATLRGLEILNNHGIDVKVITLPEGSDPDDILRENNLELFNEYMDKAESLVDFKIDMIIKGRNLNDPGVKIKTLKEAAELISGIDNEMEKEIYVERTSQKMNFDKNVLNKEIKMRSKKKKRKNFSRKEKKIDKRRKVKKSDIVRIQEQLLSYFITHKHLRSSLSQIISADDFYGKGKKLAKIIWNGPFISDSVSSDKIKSELGEDLKSYWSEIIVKQKSGLNKDKLFNLAKFVVEKNLEVSKNEICSRLNNGQNDLQTLNQMLKKFHSLNSNSERGD